MSSFRKRILILGGGFASAYTLLHLEKLLTTFGFRNSISLSLNFDVRSLHFCRCIRLLLD
jgi:hypothetical protein